MGARVRACSFPKAGEQRPEVQPGVRPAPLLFLVLSLPAPEPPLPASLPEQTGGDHRASPPEPTEREHDNSTTATGGSVISSGSFRPEDQYHHHRRRNRRPKAGRMGCGRGGAAAVVIATPSSTSAHAVQLAGLQSAFVARLGAWVAGMEYHEECVLLYCSAP